MSIADTQIEALGAGMREIRDRVMADALNKNTPQDHAFIIGFVTGMYWLWTRGYVESSDRLVDALREHKIYVQDLAEAGLDAHVLAEIAGRGAPVRQD